MQTVSGAHTRFVVAVGATVWYSLAVQTVSGAHTRFDVAVGATVWYSLAVQVVRFAQVRSERPVAATVSYCVAVHTVSGVQTPVARAQKFPALQSVTSQQVFAAMQVPEFVEHTPDWHAVACVATVHPAVPSVRPHLPFVPQTFVVHSGAVVALDA